ncbi:MAG: hypothetical protein AAGA96_13505 [Verrucomicrobiota bacterium]
MASEEKAISISSKKGTVSQDQIRYTPIPLPSQAPLPRKVGIWTEFILRMRQRGQKPPPMGGSNRRRGNARRSAPQRDLFRAFLISGIVHSLIILSLFWVVIQSPPLFLDNLIEVVPSQVSEEEPGQTESGGKPAEAAAPTQKKFSSSASTRGAHEGSSMKSIERLSLQPNPNSPSLSGDGIETMTGALNFGPSLNASDFLAIASQKRKAAKEAFEGMGKGESGFGLSFEVMEGLFPERVLGNGAALYLFLDLSGSMQQIGTKVYQYVTTTFPEGEAVGVSGCSIRAPDDSFVRNLANAAALNRHEDFYFVCDLYDGQAAPGIQALRRALLSGNQPKRLHIISFGEGPNLELSSLIKETGGKFVYIDPHLSSEQVKQSSD